MIGFCSALENDICKRIDVTTHMSMLQQVTTSYCCNNCCFDSQVETREECNAAFCLTMCHEGNEGKGDCTIDVHLGYSSGCKDG